MDDDSQMNCELLVDESKLTPELATEINSFWSDGAELLLESGKDPVKAVIRRAAVLFMGAALENPEATLDRLNDIALRDQEGWPPAAQLGIQLTGVDGTPSLSAYSIALDELPMKPPSYLASDTTKGC